MTDEHPSALDLESLAAGAEVPDASAHLAQCAACRAHVEALEAGAARIGPAAPFMAKIRARARPAPPRTLRRAAVVTVAIGLAASLFLFVRAPRETTTLKGRLSLSVIRERGGAQERVSTQCRVRPGDGLRLEFVTDEPRTLTAGVVAADGTWFELEPPARFESGTHLSRSSLRVDNGGLTGRAMVGDPADVDRARHGQPSGAVGVALERDTAP